MSFMIDFWALKLLWFNKHCKRQQSVLLSKILSPVTTQRSFILLIYTNVVSILTTHISHSTTVVIFLQFRLFLLCSRDLIVSLNNIICDDAMKLQLRAWEEYSRSQRDSEEKPDRAKIKATFIKILFKLQKA